MPIYLYRCAKCEVDIEVLAKISESNRVRKCSCGKRMDKQFTAPNINGGTRSANSFEPYRQAFGKSVDSWSNMGDMDKHIKKKNKEFGLNIEPLGND